MRRRGKEQMQMDTIKLRVDEASKAAGIDCFPSSPKGSALHLPLGLPRGGTSVQKVGPGHGSGVPQGFSELP